VGYAGYVNGLMKAHWAWMLIPKYHRGFRPVR
jgi:hypothetical protein